VYRALGFAFCTVLCFLPVAWFEGRGMYWWCVEPRVGEALEDVESRLGVATARSDGSVGIAYRPPSWWVLPQSGHVVIWVDRDQRVDRWIVSWR